MLYVDAHAHCYRRPVPFVTRFCNPAELLERYDEHGIEMGALLPVVNSEIYLPQANEDILEMVENHPKRFFAFCNVDPRCLINRADARLDEVLEYYRGLGARGVGEIMPSMDIMDEMVQNLFRCAEIAKLPVTTDGSDRVGGDFGLRDGMGLPGLEHTLQRFPNLIYIAHGPVFWAEYTRRTRPARCKAIFRAEDGLQHGSPRETGPITEEGVAQELLRDFPNLYAELSDGAGWLMRDEEFALRFLVEFQDRLLFGTDCCSLNDCHFTLKHWLDRLHESGRLPDPAWKKICRNNAIDLFGLPLEKA